MASESVARARGGLPRRYARDLAPARCRFRSTRFLPRSTGRVEDPPHRPVRGMAACPGAAAAVFPRLPAKRGPTIRL